jgi:acyl carrier protein
MNPKREKNFKAVLDAIREVKNPKGITITELTRVDELEVDSLDFVDLLYELEKEVGSDLNFSQLQKWKRVQTQSLDSPFTIKDILDYLEADLGST